MAESSSGNGEEGGGGNWWSGWVQAAKEKSAQTYEFIKKDLSEFRNVCSNETSNMVARSSQALQETLQADHSQSTDLVKKGISSVLGSITQALTIPPDDDDDDDMLRVGSTGNLEMFDKAKARLYEIQTSVTTYCTEPDGPPDLFDTWRDNFDLESKKPEISELLVSVTEVRSIYTKLVPSAVSHADFWERYYYKVHQLNLDEQRKNELKTRADQLNNEEQDWGDDWGDEQGASSAHPEISTEPSEIALKPVEPVAQLELPEQALASPSTDQSSDSSIQASDATLQPEISTTPDSVVCSDSADSATSAQAEHLEPAEITELNQETESAAVETDKPAHEEEAREVSAVTPVVNTPTDVFQVDVEPVEVMAVGSVPVEVTTDGSMESEVKEVKMKEKGDYMMVGSDSNTPASSIASTGKASESSVLDDDWEKELFGDDLKAVQELADKIDIKSDKVNADGWEEWE